VYDIRADRSEERCDSMRERQHLKESKPTASIDGCAAVAQPPKRWC